MLQVVSRYRFDRGYFFFHDPVQFSQKLLPAEVIFPHERGHSPCYQDREDHGHACEQGERHAEVQHHEDCPDEGQNAGKKG